MALTALVAGCAGLKQFPDASKDFAADLVKDDAAYAKALQDSAKPRADPVAIRNHMIDERLRVMDIKFTEYIQALARENVSVNFGVAVAQVGIGGAGALVSETASQILSAVSGGLAGGQQAYSKSALFEQAMPALLAQMIAARKSILVKILAGRGSSIDNYPLSVAAQDLEAYFVAGSLPGAFLATSADAKVKNDQAEKTLDKYRTNSFTNDTAAQRIRAFVRPPNGKSGDPVNAANLEKVQKWIEASPVKGLAIANFLTNPDLADLRNKMISDLSIP